MQKHVTIKPASMFLYRYTRGMFNAHNGDFQGDLLEATPHTGLYAVWIHLLVAWTAAGWTEEDSGPSGFGSCPGGMA